MENRNSVNNSGIGILCSKNSNERLAVPAVAGLLVTFDATAQQRKREGILWEITAIGITTIGPI